MMLRKALLSALTLGVLAAVPAMAEDAKHDGAHAAGVEMKNPADTDGDGFLSRAEFDAANAKRFAEMDSDSDGKISKDEHKAHREAKKAEWKEKRQEWKEKRAERKGETAPAPAAE